MKKILIPILTTIALALSCQKAPEEVPVASITIGQTTAEMIIGENTQLQVSISPSNATDKTVIWGSSKQSVAIVSNSGLVTAVAEGNTTITATAGGKSATCAVTVSKGVIAVTSVELNKTTLELVEGESETLVVTVKPSDATDKTVTWSTSDKTIATVENGKVTAVKEGEATITAKAGEKEATCKVVVSKKVIPVSSVELNKASLALTEGDSETLVATVKPDDATDKTVTWSTSDKTIATVENGKVTAVKEGEATITAKAGEKEATCKVVVSKKVIPVSSVELNKASLALTEGDSETLVATVNPDDATDKTVTWSSSDEKIATVENGKVSAIKEGSVTITATAGDKKATCKVTVQKKVIAVESVTLNQTTLTLYEGQSSALVATVKPDDATDKSVTWSSSASEIATVDQEGKVSAIKAGSATITAKAGEKQATCQVTVEAPAPLPNPFAGKKWGFIDGPVTWTFTFTDSEVIFDYLNTVSGTPTKEQYRDPYTYTETTVSFTLHVWSGIEFDLTGTLQNDGSIDFEDDGFQDFDFHMDPYIDVTSITLSQTSIQLEVGASKTLIATISPANATNQNVIWRTSDDSIASVSNGVVTAVAEGACTITALAGDKTATCTVTVTQPSNGPEAVDLGLSVKWASYNVGATKPEEYGDYFAWGETEPKNTYYWWTTYKWCNGSYDTLIKYNNSSSNDNKSEFKDNGYVDDAARQALGGKWRMPTDAEWTELRTKCTWTWTTNYIGTGVKGEIVTATNGNSIFLPAAGYREEKDGQDKLTNEGDEGCYWSSTLYTADAARSAFFNSDMVYRYEYSRCYGLSIRPVSE